MFLTTFEIKLPDLPTVDPEKYQKDVAYRIEFDEECKLIAKERRDWENDKKYRMWALILGQLSRNAREELERYPDWANMSKARDPLRLWKRVTSLHLFGTEKNNLANIMNKAMRASLNVQQQPAETGGSYKKRFDLRKSSMENLCGLEDANTDVREPVKYPEEMVIVHFLEKLDMSRYARLKQDYDNGLIARFGSLSDAYENVVIILLFTTNTKQSRSD